MRIDVAGARKDFFRVPSPAQLLDRRGIAPSTFKDFQEVQDLLGSGRFVSGATEQSAGAAIGGEASARSVVRAADKLRPGQVLVLPKSAYVGQTRASRLRNYVDEAFASVDRVAVGRSFTGDQEFAYWTDELRNERRATPQRLLPLALDFEVPGNPLLGYTFGDNLVEWAHLILGAELRVWQNKFGYYKGIENHERRLEELSVLEKKLRGPDVSLAADKRAHRDTIRFYEDRIRYYGIYEELDVLTRHGHDCLDDVIEVDGTPGVRRVWYGQNKTVDALAHWRMKLFRRRSPDDKRVVGYENVPAVPHRFSSVTPSLVYKMQVRGDTEHEFYGNLALRGHPWTAEAIAGAHTIARIVQKSDELSLYDFEEPEPSARWKVGQFSVADMPFPIPTREGIRFADTLRYDTLFLSYDSERGRVVSETTNLATLSKFFGDKVLVDGVDESLAMDKRELYDRGEDPMEYAVTLEYDDMNP